MWRFFVIFSKFSENLNLLFFKIWNSQPCSWVLSGVTNLATCDCSNATAKMLLVSEMWRFFVFFSKFLQEIIYKEISKIWNYQLDEDTTLLSAYTQASQILPLNMNARILLVFEIRCFFMIYSIFVGNLKLKKVHEIWNSQRYSRVLSGALSACKSGLQISPEAH